MRFLADENLEATVLTSLRDAGHDVLSASQVVPGVDDETLLALSVDENRVLLTNDKDFADLIFFQQKKSVGVVLIRMPVATSAEKATTTLRVISSFGTRLIGSLTVVHSEVVRRRPLPNASS